MILEDERGQVTPLMVAGLGLVVLMVLALGPMGRVLVDRAQARTAADAAALAGAARGEAAARSLARANGGSLVSFELEAGDVIVEVEVDGVNAYSRARAVRTWDGPGQGPSSPGTGAQAGLTPAMVAALQRAERLLGQAVPITSGYRSPAQQQALWDRRHLNPFPVARPGTSRHERGLAVDVPSSVVGRLLQVAGQAGLCQPMPVSDPIHFELCGAR